MDDVTESYSNLKALLIIPNSSIVNEDFDINPLKDLFCQQINSQRTLCQIDDLFSLVTILEKRDILNPEDVSSLEYIFDALKLSSVTLHNHKSIIDERARKMRKSLSENNNSEQQPNQEFKHLSKPHPTPAGRTPTADIKHSQSKLPDEVVSAVASQIGYSWKGLARYLGCVKEGTLEKIEENRAVTTNEMRARLMLAEYEREVDPSEICSKLLKALEVSKRKDLHDQVVKILLKKARN